MATLVLLTVVGVREAAAPGGSTVLEAVQTSIESEWDENVGKLTYVGNMLTESVQVFGKSSRDDHLVSPVKAEAVQTFSANAPYLLYENAGDVFAAASGEVLSLSHDDASRYTLRILHDNGLECLYYGLDSCVVQEGDLVDTSTLLGMSSGSAFAFEVRRSGKAIDAGAFLEAR